MKALKKNFLNALMALVMIVCCVLSGWSAPIAKVIADASLETAFTNDGQFTVSQYGTNTLEYVDGEAGADGVALKVSSVGGSSYILFSAPQVKASTVESIVVRMYSPEYSASDSFRASNADLSASWLMNEAKDMSTWCDITLSENLIAQMTDANGYLSNQVLFGARVHGTATAYYIDSITINLVRDWEAEFTGGLFTISNYSGDAVNFPYQIMNGDKASLPVGYTGAVARIGSLVNGGAAYTHIDFSAAQIPADSVESVVARVYSPDYTALDELRLNNGAGSVGGAGAHDMSTWCDVTLPLSIITGNDGNLGAFDFGLRDKGTVSEYFYIDSITVTMMKEPEIIPVTFSNINVTWNDNTDILNNGMRYTVLHLNGLLTSGYLGQGDDWSNMLANSTINGGASYFSFSSASFIAGPDVAADFIILYSATAPTAGDQFVVTAGSTFKVGGADKNIYQLTDDIRLVYNGTAWEVAASATYYVVESVNPEIIHVLTAYQNADGSYTYNLPAYTQEGNVLLGFAVTENDTEKFLPAGAYTTTETGLIFSALWANFTTMDGASIRISSAETSGIRWTTNIDEAGFSNLIYWSKGNYQFGTELSADGFSENFDIVVKTWKVENRQYTGVLTDINSSYYDKAFTARGYVDVTYTSGETKRIYAQANDTTRSIKQVAQLAIASGDYSGAQLSILQQIAGV